MKKMKKLLIMSAITFAAISGGKGQTIDQLAINDTHNGNMEVSEFKMNKHEYKKDLRKLNNSEVSFFSKEHFYEDFGYIPDAEWTKSPNFDEVTFTLNGHELTAFYDDNSSLVGTTSEKAFSDLPLNAQNYINKKYGDYTVKDVLFYDDNEMNSSDMVLYDLEFNDPDSYFVELQKDNKDIILQVPLSGSVNFFKALK
jgi:hypothetical protein